MKITSQKLIGILESMIGALDDHLPTTGLSDEEKQHVLSSFLVDSKVQGPFYFEVYTMGLPSRSSNLDWVREAITPPPDNPPPTGEKKES